MSRGLLVITKDYWRLLVITRDYWRLLHLLLQRIFRRLLFPAFGAPTMATWTPLRSLSPLRPSFRWSVTSFWSRITWPLTVKWLHDHMTTMH